MADTAVQRPGTRKAARPGTTLLRAGIVLIPGGFLGALLVSAILGATIQNSPSVWAVYVATVVIVGGFLVNALGTAAVIEGFRRRLRASRAGALAVGGAIVAPIWGIFCYSFFGMPALDSVLRTPYHLEDWERRRYQDSVEVAEIIGFAPLIAAPVLFVAGLVAGVVWLWRRAA